MNERESIEQFQARGGIIQQVQYKPLDDVGEVPSSAGMRGIINNGRLLSYRAKLAGIASGKARRGES